MIQAITNVQIHTGKEVLSDKVLLIENSQIVGIENKLPERGETEVIDLDGMHLSPGLIDIQINGGYTHYFSQHPDEESLTDIDTACFELGTPYYLATLISATQEKISRALQIVRAFKEQHPKSGLLGMHLEGPFFNPLKKGAHDKDIIRNPTDQELEKIVQEGKDIIKVMTIAPELFSDDQIKYLQNSGIRLSAGHSNMNYEEAMHCFDLGIRLVTHLYNAMSPFAHRAPGLTGAALLHPEVYTSLILDGHHCHYAAAHVAHRLKSDKLFLITDSSFLGRRKQQFQFDNFDAKLIDGTFRNKDGNLAGAAISMPEAIKNAVDHLGLPLQEAIEMATSRPATAIGMSDQIGFIKPGFPANFFVFNPDITSFKSLRL